MLAERWDILCSIIAHSDNSGVSSAMVQFVSWNMDLSVSATKWSSSKDSAAGQQPVAAAKARTGKESSRQAQARGRSVGAAAAKEEKLSAAVAERVYEEIQGSKGLVTLPLSPPLLSFLLRRIGKTMADVREMQPAVFRALVVDPSKGLAKKLSDRRLWYHRTIQAIPKQEGKCIHPYGPPFAGLIYDILQELLEEHGTKVLPSIWDAEHPCGTTLADFHAMCQNSPDQCMRAVQILKLKRSWHEKGQKRMKKLLIRLDDSVLEEFCISRLHAEGAVMKLGQAAKVRLEREVHIWSRKLDLQALQGQM